jgi:hypothetical protein
MERALWNLGMFLQPPSSFVPKAKKHPYLQLSSP